MPGLLESFLSTVDNYKRAARNRLTDLVSNPADFVSMVNDQATNYNRAVEPVVQGNELFNRAYSPEAKQQRDMELAMALMPAGVGHIAYHGSPHKFDKFALEKIGTGEGKQQQGMGAYLAEAQAVGQKYANRLAEMHGKDAGHLYKVDIPDDAMGKIAEYNKPFRQQTDEVRKAVLPLLDDQVKHNLRGYYGWETHEDAPMQAIMESIDLAKGNDRNATSSALRESGVLGIKYLDGGSRGAGEGSSNFVMFNPEMIRILERNGQATGNQPWQPGEWKP